MTDKEEDERYERRERKQRIRELSTVAMAATIIAEGFRSGQSAPDVIAKRSFDLADAMLKEQDKRQPKEEV